MRRLLDCDATCVRHANGMGIPMRHTHAHTHTLLNPKAKKKIYNVAAAWRCVTMSDASLTFWLEPPRAAAASSLWGGLFLCALVVNYCDALGCVCVCACARARYHVKSYAIMMMMLGMVRLTAFAVGNTLSMQPRMIRPACAPPVGRSVWSGPESAPTELCTTTRSHTRQTTPCHEGRLHGGTLNMQWHVLLRRIWGKVRVKVDVRFNYYALGFCICRLFLVHGARGWVVRPSDAVYGVIYKSECGHHVCNLCAI